MVEEGGLCDSAIKAMYKEGGARWVREARCIFNGCGDESYRSCGRMAGDKSTEKCTDTGVCFTFKNVARSIADAIAGCEKDGMTLAKVENPDEALIVGSMGSTINFIGLTNVE